MRARPPQRGDVLNVMQGTTLCLVVRPGSGPQPGPFGSVLCDVLFSDGTRLVAFPIILHDDLVVDLDLEGGP